MTHLFVEKTIEIGATPFAVWKTLTDPGLNIQWIRLWRPELTVLESDWKPDSRVLWKMGDAVGSEGTVLAAEPFRWLHFTFKVNDSSSGKQEEIRYELTESHGSTTLSVSVGDFGDTPEHEACYPGAVTAWNLSLPKIKELAEMQP